MWRGCRRRMWSRRWRRLWRWRGCRVWSRRRGRMWRGCGCRVWSWCRRRVWRWRGCRVWSWCRRCVWRGCGRRVWCWSGRRMWSRCGRGCGLWRGRGCRLKGRFDLKSLRQRRSTANTIARFQAHHPFAEICHPDDGCTGRPCFFAFVQLVARACLPPAQPIERRAGDIIPVHRHVQQTGFCGYAQLVGPGRNS